MKQKIDKKGLSKSVTQIKSKLCNMKDAYKKAKRYAVHISPESKIYENILPLSDEATVFSQF